MNINSIIDPFCDGCRCVSEKLRERHRHHRPTINSSIFRYVSMIPAPEKNKRTLKGASSCLGPLRVRLVSACDQFGRGLFEASACFALVGSKYTCVSHPNFPTASCAVRTDQRSATFASPLRTSLPNSELRRTSADRCDRVAGRERNMAPRRQHFTYDVHTNRYEYVVQQ